jgi:hypothetical protein
VGTGDAARSANPNKANALYAILFEAISLVMQYNNDKPLLTTCVSVLGNFLTAKVRGGQWWCDVIVTLCSPSSSHHDLSRLCSTARPTHDATWGTAVGCSF